MQLERLACIVVSFAMSTLAPAQQTMEHNIPSHVMEMSVRHEQHGSAVSVTYDDLTKTASQLGAARRATAKYQDVRIAEADGYRAFGPDVPGMGIHYVGPHSSGFDVEHPDILLYEKNEAVPGGFSLVGVSYLLKAETGADGQPKDPRFPKSLASWHRHSDLCVFPDRSVKANLTETDCVVQGGRFNALTQWMIHAWIWKDSPTGVFSPTNRDVR
jgi:hypothetical protein